jgi:type II restriction/modification system DNA methylase subunit YeeA
MTVPEHFFEDESEKNRKDRHVEQYIDFNPETLEKNHEGHKKNQYPDTNETVAEKTRRIQPSDSQLAVDEIDNFKGGVHRTDPAAVEPPQEGGEKRGDSEYNNPELKLMMEQQKDKNPDGQQPGEPLKNGNCSGFFHSFPRRKMIHRHRRKIM